MGAVSFSSLLSFLLFLSPIPSSFSLSCLFFRPIAVFLLSLPSCCCFLLFDAVSFSFLVSSRFPPLVAVLLLFPLCCCFPSLSSSCCFPSLVAVFRLFPLVAVFLLFPPCCCFLLLLLFPCLSSCYCSLSIVAVSFYCCCFLLFPLASIVAVSFSAFPSFRPILLHSSIHSFIYSSYHLFHMMSALCFVGGFSILFLFSFLFSFFLFFF